MNKLLLLLLSGLMLFGCKEIIEKDISEDLPIIILPSNNASINENPVFFKWGDLDGATKYKVQIVSPSFDSILSYPVDSVVSGTEIYFNLDSNDYQVRLMALNAGYETAFTSPINFSLESGQSQGSNIVLISPGNNSFDNALFDYVFEWQTFPDATSYEFSLRQGNDFSTGTIVYHENQIASNTIDISSQVTLTEGEYIWGVKAYTSTGETMFSTFQLNIDETNPNTPSLITPANSAFLSAGSNNFTWDNGIDPGNVNSTVISTIEIATDINFNNVIDFQSVSAEMVDFNITTPGTYYWRVFNDDEAGNFGAISLVYSFTLN